MSPALAWHRTHCVHCVPAPCVFFWFFYPCCERKKNVVIDIIGFKLQANSCLWLNDCINLRLRNFRCRRNTRNTRAREKNVHSSESGPFCIASPNAQSMRHNSAVTSQLNLLCVYRLPFNVRRQWNTNLNGMKREKVNKYKIVVLVVTVDCRA